MNNLRKRGAELISPHELEVGVDKNVPTGGDPKLPTHN